MNKAEVISGLNKTIEGLMLLRSLIDGSDDSSVSVPENVPPIIPVAGSTKFDRDKLDAMPYNEFKKLAARLGVKCTGTRDQIVERVMALNANTNGDTATASDPGEIKGDTEKTAKKEDQPKSQPKSDKPSGGKRSLKRAAPVPAEDEFDLKAKEVADNTPVKDILAALNEVGVKATSKNFLPKLADALRQNLLSIDDEDKTADTPDAPETPDDASDEIEADSYFPQYDPDGFNDPANMSEERQEAVVAKVDEILTSVSEGALTPESIQTYLEENATQEELDLLGDEPTEDDMLRFFIELQKRLIDNGGDIHESSDPYELGKHDMCCGHKLKFVEKTKKYVCEMCGTEYEAE